MKKKFIIFISIISLFILIFSLSAFADDEWSIYGQTIESGTTLTFYNRVPTWTYLGSSFVYKSIKFTCNNTQYNYMAFYQNRYVYYSEQNTSQGTFYLYDDRSSPSVNPNALTIILTQNYTLTQGDFISEFLINNVANGLPEPPPPPEPSAAEKAYNATSGLIANSFSGISQITSFLSGNAAIGICTIGILVISFVFGLLMRLRKKSFKTR